MDTIDKLTQLIKDTTINKEAHISYKQFVEELQDMFPPTSTLKWSLRCNKKGNLEYCVYAYTSSRSESYYAKDNLLDKLQEYALSKPSFRKYFDIYDVIDTDVNKTETRIFMKSLYRNLVKDECQQEITGEFLPGVKIIYK